MSGEEEMGSAAAINYENENGGAQFHRPGIKFLDLL